MQALTNPRLRLPVLLLVAIAARWMTFGNPVVQVDEEFYFVTASRMWHGAIPFIDVWDRKPIGLFLLYMPAAALPLPWGTLAFQALALFAVVTTADIIARLATRAGWANGATFAGIAYILWLDPLGGMSGQSPVFYNLPMAGAAMLIASAHQRDARIRGLVAMALVGVCLQIKYSVVFEGIVFGLWLLGHEWREHRSLPALLIYGVTLIGVALLPTALAFAAYAMIGEAQAFLFANFTSILSRNPDPWPEAMGNAGSLILLLSPLVAMAFGSKGLVCDGDPGLRRFLFVWFAASLAGIALFGGWFDHYGLPAAVPGAICSAGFLGAGRWRGKATPAILLLAAIIGQVTLVVNILNRGTAGQLAGLTAAVGRGPGCLYVYSGTTMLYRTTERCTLTRYLFPSHLGRMRETDAIGVDQATEVRRIVAQRPVVIVMRPAYGGERKDIRAIVTAAVERDYRHVASPRMGDRAIAVYHRKP